VLRAAGWAESAIPDALAVSWCESRYSPYGWNGVDAGLFGLSTAKNATIRGSWFDWAGVSEDAKFDALTNARVAWLAYQHSGWAIWSCRP